MTKSIIKLYFLMKKIIVINNTKGVIKMTILFYKAIDKNILDFCIKYIWLNNHK
jgi:hypothetical protein